MKNKHASPKTTARSRRPANGLQITLMNADVTQVVTPIIVAGHYKGVAPLDEVQVLDEELNHWISQAGEHGMIGANLGELFFIPIEGNQIAARAIVLAGMGEYGRFGYGSLRYLMMNVTYAVSAIGNKNFACVLIGTGIGGMEISEAIKATLSGVCDAIDHLKAEKKPIINELVLVESTKGRFDKLARALKAFDGTKLGSLKINITKSSLPKIKGRRRRKPQPNRPSGSVFANRITVEKGKDGFQFYALTESAVIPVRKVNVQKFFADGIAERLRTADGDGEQKRFGRLLHRYIFPEDFEQLIKDDKPLTLIVDKATAALPWEMACFGPEDPPHQRIYFGRDLKLTRQFRTTLSAAPGVSPPLNTTLKFLIIADPAPETDLQLDHAR
ncbi:MAG: M17 family peptidase N-terminal domain-containing protein, partial [Blastocatellia bacterium]